MTAAPLTTRLAELQAALLETQTALVEERATVAMLRKQIVDRDLRIDSIATLCAADIRVARATVRITGRKPALPQQEQFAAGSVQAPRASDEFDDETIVRDFER